MADAGTRYTDAAQAELERRFRAIYREAQEDIIKKLDAHTKRLNVLDKIKRAQVEAGTLSQEEYRNWLNGQVFIGKQWKDKVDSVATSLLYANQQANDMIEGKKRAVFGENATYQAYSLEHDAGMDLSFGIYDSATVTRLIKEQPELLPRKVVNGVKDKAWNRTKIANAVTQGIIQGEGIPEIAKRIARQVGSDNMEAMTRYARTAMTGAQNAGRMEMLHEAQAMGINVKKKWLATLDKRTRDAHANLDGQTAEVDEPFKSDLGPIMFPGDFSAHPANTWNCRCTMIYEYPEYMPQNAQRRAYNEDRTESEIIKDQTYLEWYESKKTNGIIGPNVSKEKAKTKAEIIQSYAHERRVYDKVSGMVYDATDGDTITLQEGGRKNINGEWIPFSQETGQVTIPSNPDSQDVMIYNLPKGQKTFMAFDETKNTILPGGRIAINSNTQRSDTRRKITDMLENEIDALGGIRKDGVFWRVTGNAKEADYIRKGTIRASVNHMTNEVEDGLSVWERPKYFDKFTERLTGEVISIGSDGEPLLDIKTVRLANDLGKSIKELQEEGRQKFLDLYGWTEEQLDKALKGSYKIRR